MAGPAATISLNIHQVEMEREGKLNPEPAVFGTQAARTMYASLHGEFMPHPRPDALGKVSQDAYSLFYARSAAMGWLAPAVEDGPDGLWGMNDAEAGSASGPRPSRVAYFQVVLTGSSPEKVPPVQPFLSCAGDVVERLGRLRLEAVQVLLPERDADADGRPASPSGMAVAASLLDALNWFADCDPRRRAEVRITLDGGPDSTIRAAAPGIVQWVQEIDQNVFSFDSLSLADDDYLVLAPTTFYRGLADSDHHRVTLRGTLAEWSLDALGWLAAFLADVSSRHGTTTPLMLTADRSAPSG
ncbi:MAG: hypothetical protein M3Z75_32135 [Actinomycetota bacterium]|nr:hypothetical protein [Actinomycetota bacterium]